MPKATRTVVRNRAPLTSCSTSRSAALRGLGPVLYAMRMDDGAIKIGYTTDLEDRERTVRRQYPSSTSELLAVKVGGTFDEEQAIHARLCGYRVTGKQEYYHPRGDVLAVVNDLRAAVNLPPLETTSETAE